MAFVKGKRRISDADLTKKAIALSGLSARQFAIQVAGVDERNVRRWLAGNAMHPLRRAWLEAWIPAAVKVKKGAR